MSEIGSKEWWASRLRIETAHPSAEERNVALTHLRGRGEATIGAQSLAKALETDMTSGMRLKSASSIADETHIALVETLFAAGKLSYEDRVFMAGSNAMRVHEGRYSQYDDVAAISAEIGRIEREHGLSKDEYWPIGEGPEEWERLQVAFTVAMSAHYEETLIEFDLKDLAKLYSIDRAGFDAAYEAGRRAMFHKDDVRNAVARLVGQYEADARRSESVDAAYAAIVMYGAACEARLLLMVLDYPDEALAAVASLPARDRPRKEPLLWSLADLILVSRKAGWLRSIDDEGSALPGFEWAGELKSCRNLVHPGRHALERPHVAVASTALPDTRAYYTIVAAELAEWVDLQKEAAQSPS